MEQGDRRGRPFRRAGPPVTSLIVRDRNPLVGEALAFVFGWLFGRADRSMLPVPATPVDVEAEPVATPPPLVPVAAVVPVAATVPVLVEEPVVGAPLDAPAVARAPAGWRRSAARAVAVVGIVALVAIPVAAWRWYRTIGRSPSPPGETPGLYVLADRPGVTATLEVSVSQPAAPHPVARIRVATTIPSRVAVLGQGRWAFVVPPTGGPGAALAGQVALGSAKPWPFAPPEDAERTVLVEDLTATATADVEVRLQHALANTRRGQLQGALPLVSAQVAGGASALVTGTPGTWMGVSSTSVQVSVTSEPAYRRVDSVFPAPAAAADGAAPGQLLWSGSGAIATMRWEATDPGAEASAERALLLVGVLLGVWAATLVAVVLRGLDRLGGNTDRGTAVRARSRAERGEATAVAEGPAPNGSAPGPAEVPTVLVVGDADRLPTAAPSRPAPAPAAPETDPLGRAPETDQLIDMLTTRRQRRARASAPGG